MHAISIHDYTNDGEKSFAPQPIHLAPRGATPLPFQPPPPFNPRFWMVFLALAVSSFLSALDLTSISTLLPTLATAFNSPNYSWVGSAYALTSTALIPFTGSCANIFGRRPAMLASLFLFVAGSAISGASPTINVIIIGRSIQGAGGGGILAMTEIIICDLVPLAQRGLYMGIIGCVWAVASACGPPVGGAFASGGLWRWLFYMNIPIGLIALALVGFCLNVKVPKTTWRQKFAQMDWANIIFVGGATSMILGLTWGGTFYPWSSVKVIATLAAGGGGMILFLVVECFWIKNPTVPFALFRHRTTLVGFLDTFIHGALVTAAVYYLPVYFQSAKHASALMSGVDSFSLSFTVAPFAIVAGASIAITRHYWAQNVVGWVFVIVGFWSMTLLKWDSSMAEWVGFPIILGIGLGILYTATIFPVVAPLPPSRHPQAMAFHAFVRSFGQVLGITGGSTILTNGLSSKLPAEYVAMLPEGSASNAVAAIPTVMHLPEPLRTQVRVAFASSLSQLWREMIYVGAAGALISLFMKNLPMTDALDESWGLDNPDDDNTHSLAPLRPPPPLTSFRHMSLQRLSTNLAGFGQPEIPRQDFRGGRADFRGAREVHHEEMDEIRFD
ncbi:hypothetical protein RQP46_003387 [Phenoliferia psychrophenolica]